MFNVENTGRKISVLRKEKNMTQMELADKMNISFQAVSNWERGNSMPDISKLPELAEILDVSVDVLLGEKSVLLENIINNSTDEYLKKNSVSPNELLEIAPLLKPEQADTIFTNTTPPFELSEIFDILPFISQDTINEIARNMIAKDMSVAEIAPFISRDTISEIAENMIAKDMSIAEIAPFISSDMIGKLAIRLYEKRGLPALDDVAPFIPSDVLNNIAEREFDNRGLRHLDSIAPFMNREYLNKLAKKAIQKDGIKAISPIAPFLDKNLLSEYVKEKFLNNLL
jgi:transcriptional regulator with XRE-family HTH domain